MATTTINPKVLKDGSLKVTAGDRVMYTSKLETGALAGTTIIAYVPIGSAKADLKVSITAAGKSVNAQASKPETPADAETSPALESLIAAAVKAALAAQ